MPTFPKDSAGKHFPGIGDEYVVISSQLGINVINVTLAANTAITDANLVAAPPNTVSVASGVVVHSLGAAPFMTWVRPMSSSISGINFNFVTADNSAIYYKAFTWTGVALAGIRVQVVGLR